MQNCSSIHTPFEVEPDGEHPLQALANSLQQIVQRSEDDFLALGGNLQQVQLQSSRHRDSIAASMQLFESGEDRGILPQITSYVRGSQGRTDQAQQAASELCGNLLSMSKLLQGVARNSHSLERTGMFLKVIGINTGIECARHEMIERTFKVVSRDTINLAGQIQQATETLLDRTSRAQTEQQQTLRRSQAGIDALQQLSGETNQATDAALSQVAELVDYSVAMIQNAEQMAQKISEEISRVVMGIQFHDNLRQRIEHINQALLETEQLSADAAPEESCRVYLTIELQKAQLETLVGELGHLYASQNKALGSIVAAVSGLEERLGQMASEDSLTQQGEGPVEVLLAAVHGLENLGRDSQALGTTIRASGDRAVQIVTEMQTALQGTFVIANSVKINALNAIIKAAKFGRQGEALEVLAQGMVSVSSEVRQLVDDFNLLLEQLVALAGTGEVATPGAADAGQDGFDSSQVDQAFRQFRQELTGTRQECRQLQDKLQAEQDRLEFIRELQTAVAEHAAQLGIYAERIAPEDQGLLEELRGAFGDQFASRYTMDEERAIHNRTLHRATPAAAPLAAVLAAESPRGAQPAPEADCDWPAGSQAESSAPVAEDALEIELWDSPAGETEGKTVAETRPLAEGTFAIELWETSVAEPESAKVANTQLSAGDDPAIELWETTAAQPESAAAADTQPPTGDDPGIELWDAPAENPQSAAADKKNKSAETTENQEDFGANVELF